MDLFTFHKIIPIPLIRLLGKQCSLRQKATKRATTSVGLGGVVLVCVECVIKLSMSVTVEGSI